MPSPLRMPGGRLVLEKLSTAGMYRTLLLQVQAERSVELASSRDCKSPANCRERAARMRATAMPCPRLVGTTRRTPSLGFCDNITCGVVLLQELPSFCTTSFLPGGQGKPEVLHTSQIFQLQAGRCL